MHMRLRGFVLLNVENDAWLIYVEMILAFIVIYLNFTCIEVQPRSVMLITTDNRLLKMKV